MIAERDLAVPAREAFETLKRLKDEGYNVLVDMTAVDYSAVATGAKGDATDALKRAAPWLAGAGPIASAEGEEYGAHKMPDDPAKRLKPRAKRFEVIYRLMKLNLATGLDEGRALVRCEVGDDELVLRSVMSLWPIADWLEREVWDMFGIGFVDRQGIKRLLMYEQFQGHPLRKDYPITRRQPLIGPPSGERENSPSFNSVKPTVRYE